MIPLQQMNRSPYRFVVLMGFVAMLGDITYQGARGLHGPFLSLLGASAFAIGFFAGLGEFLGYGLRLWTGWLGDKTRAYWTLVALGYATNLVAVPGLALIGSWQAAMVFVLLERIGKAIRSPSRSTLVSYASSELGAGKAFGLDEALDQLGAVIGPLLTALIMWVVREDAPIARYQLAFAVLLLPVIGNLALLWRAHRSYPNPEAFGAKAAEVVAPSDRHYRWYLFAVALFAFGFADWALVAFHVQKTQLLSGSMLPILYAAAMAIDALAAIVLGTWFDKVGLRALAVASLISAGFAPLIFWLGGLPALFIGVAMWSIGLGAQDAIFKAAIATMVPKASRGRAYGRFFALVGFFWWAGSALMGYLYDVDRWLMVVVSVAPQLLAAPIFYWLSGRLRQN
jgi:MFS family permease